MLRTTMFPVFESLLKSSYTLRQNWLVNHHLYIISILLPGIKIVIPSFLTTMMKLHILHANSPVR